MMVMILKIGTKKVAQAATNTPQSSGFSCAPQSCFTTLCVRTCLTGSWLSSSKTTARSDLSLRVGSGRIGSIPLIFADLLDSTDSRQLVQVGVQKYVLPDDSCLCREDCVDTLSRGEIMYI